MTDRTAADPDEPTGATPADPVPDTPARPPDPAVPPPPAEPGPTPASLAEPSPPGDPNPTAEATATPPPARNPAAVGDPLTPARPVTPHGIAGTEGKLGPEEPRPWIKPPVVPPPPAPPSTGLVKPRSWRIRRRPRREHPPEPDATPPDLANPAAAGAPGPAPAVPPVPSVAPPTPALVSPTPEPDLPLPPAPAADHADHPHDDRAGYRDDRADDGDDDPRRWPRLSRRLGRRGVLLTVAGTVVLLCAGGGLTAWLVTRTPDVRGARGPVEAATQFLDAAYVARDGVKTRSLTCPDARDRAAVGARVQEITDNLRAYDQPTVSWSTPALAAGARADRADVTTTLTVSSADERAATQPLRLTVVRDDGWFVCEVAAGP